MYELKDRAIVNELQALELQVLMMQCELAKTNPNLAKSRYKISTKEVEILQNIDFANIAKLTQCSNQTLLGLPSAELMLKLNEKDMHPTSFEMLLAKG